MTRVTTLTTRAEFLRLNRGRKFITPFFIMRYAPALDPQPALSRVGYTVTTKCGNAVVRNRIKRRLRALVRELQPLATPGMEYVLIARADALPSAATAPAHALRAALTQAFERAK